MSQPEKEEREETDYTKLRQVLNETKSSWDGLIPKLEQWFADNGIDFGQTMIYVYSRMSQETKTAAVFLCLPGDKTFELFQGDKPDEIFDQITKRCESRVAAAPTNKDAVHLTVVDLPTNDLAYTNAVYIHDSHLEKGSLLFPEATTHVKINDSRIFRLIKHPLVQKGCIAMSSLQRDSFAPTQLPLAQLAKVSPCDITAETKVAEYLCIEFEPVANFKVDVDTSALIDFLIVKFKDCIVAPGTKLAHNEFMKRVFAFRVISGQGRIAESTCIQLIVNPKSVDVVNTQLNAKINDNDNDAALKAFLYECDALQVQMNKVRYCCDALLKK